MGAFVFLKDFPDAQGTVISLLPSIASGLIPAPSTISVGVVRFAGRYCADKVTLPTSKHGLPIVPVPPLPFHSPLVDQADAFATRVYANKPYNEGNSYRFHVRSVAADAFKVLQRHGWTQPDQVVETWRGTDITVEDVIAAALLHDVEEDFIKPKRAKDGGTAIVQAFRTSFPKSVQALTDFCNDQQPEWQAFSYRDRKRAYLTRVASPDAPKAAFIVAVADKMNNLDWAVMESGILKDSPKDYWETFNHSQAEKLQYFNRIATILGDSPHAGLTAPELQTIQHDVAQVELMLEKPTWRKRLRRLFSTTAQ